MCLQLIFNFSYFCAEMEKMNAQDFDNSILPWIGKTGKMFLVFMVDKFRHHGLDMSVEQMIILKILHEEDGRPQNDMAMVTNRHKASLTRLIDNMEKKNLVARLPDKDDKRVNRIFLTTHGRKFFQSTMPILKEAVTELQENLSEREITDLINILKKVQANMGLGESDPSLPKPCN